MSARKTEALVIAAILVFAAPLMAQTRNSRGATASRRNAPATVNRGTTPEPPTETTPRGAESPAGTVIPPNQGYVLQPEPASPGTAANAAIPSDPLDRAYWELYDRDRPVTLTGKVTRVDWTNPNSYVYLAADGALWAIESGFIQFRQASVTPAIHADETITVTAYLPKEEPGGELPAKRNPALATYLKTKHLVRAGEITTVYGQKLQMGRPPTEKEMSERLKCSAFGC